MTQPAEIPDKKTNPTDIERYYELVAKIKQLEDEKKVMNKVIKSYFNNTPGIYKVNGYKVNIYEQDRSKVDQDMLVEILKKKGLNDCLKVVVIPDEDKVEEALYCGRLTQQELEPCLQVRKSLSLLITKD